jgi:hypothetical protein
MKKIIFLLFGLVVIIELFARYILGLGNVSTYIESPLFEYIYSPNQSINRFGNVLLTNSYSMRSNPLKLKDHGTLVFGDSVLNGGSLTDHNKLATTLLENSLQKHCDDQHLRVLNISAGSWGPDNAYAYLISKVDFDSFNRIVLVFSSHDAHDNMAHENIVGNHVSFPSDKPYLALTDGFSRYFIPKIKDLLSNRDSIHKIHKIHKIDKNKEFNTGWNDFINYSLKQGIDLLVVLHPSSQEIIDGSYDENGVKIIELLNKKGVPYLLELDSYLRGGDDFTSNYRDDIHYNENGQNYLYSKILPVLKKSACSDELYKEK